MSRKMNSNELPNQCNIEINKNTWCGDANLLLH